MMKPNAPSPARKNGPASTLSSIRKRARPGALAATAAIVLLGGLVALHASREGQTPRISREMTPQYSHKSTTDTIANEREIRLCQALSPADPCPIPAVDCTHGCTMCDGMGWRA